MLYKFFIISPYSQCGNEKFETYQVQVSLARKVTVRIFCIYKWQPIKQSFNNLTIIKCYINFFFFFAVSMLRMDPALDRPWRADLQVRDWCCRIFHNVENRFFIDPIRILKCLRNRCQEIPALQAKGMCWPFFLVVRVIIVIRQVPLWFKYYHNINFNIKVSLNI